MDILVLALTFAVLFAIGLIDGGASPRAIRRLILPQDDPEEIEQVAIVTRRA